MHVNMLFSSVEFLAGQLWVHIQQGPLVPSRGRQRLCPTGLDFYCWVFT